MNLFTGLAKTDYQDVLRAVGLLLDDQGLRNFRILEHEGGIVVQAMPRNQRAVDASYRTIMLTEADIQQLLRDAYTRRMATMPGR
jgi:hypothetical protein